MPLFESIPTRKEAVQLTWENWGDICDFVPKPWFKRGVYLDKDGKPTEDVTNTIGLIIETLESQEFVAQENDWIIKGVSGEFYACKPDIFAASYKLVGEPTHEQSY